MIAGIRTENQPTEAGLLFTQSRRSVNFCIVVVVGAATTTTTTTVVVVVIIIIIITSN
jgi:hypothetical protein